MHKTTTRSMAAIFIHKDQNDREFPYYVEKGEKARRLFAVKLGFQDVHVYVNLAKI